MQIVAIIQPEIQYKNCVLFHCPFTETADNCIFFFSSFFPFVPLQQNWTFVILHFKRMEEHTCRVSYRTLQQDWILVACKMHIQQLMPGLLHSMCVENFGGAHTVLWCALSCEQWNERWPMWRRTLCIRSNKQRPGRNMHIAHATNEIHSVCEKIRSSSSRDVVQCDEHEMGLMEMPAKKRALRNDSKVCAHDSWICSTKIGVVCC